MKTNVIVSALIGSSLCASGVAWLRWQQLATGGLPDRSGIASLRSSAPRIQADSLADAEDAIVTNDPFRLSNSPAAVRYDPASDGQIIGILAGPPQPRPTLVLKAIVGGPPWQAVIDGIPGQPPGTVARAGSRFDRFTVRVVTRDSVIVQGVDTSWVLSFRAR
jgi:hypothetical protein